MSDVQVALSPDEAEFLLQTLRIALASKRVEIHRTDSPAYRRDLEHEAGLLEVIVNRLQPSSPSSKRLFNSAGTVSALGVGAAILVFLIPRPEKRCAGGERQATVP